MLVHPLVSASIGLTDEAARIKVRSVKPRDDCVDRVPVLCEDYHLGVLLLPELVSDDRDQPLQLWMVDTSYLLRLLLDSRPSGVFQQVDRRPSPFSLLPQPLQILREGRCSLSLEHLEGTEYHDRLRLLDYGAEDVP